MGLRRKVSALVCTTVLFAGCGAQHRHRVAPRDQTGAYEPGQVIGFAARAGLDLRLAVPPEDGVAYVILEPRAGESAAVRRRFGSFAIFLVSSPFGLRYVLSDGHGRPARLDRDGIFWTRSDTVPGVPAAWVATTRYRNLVLKWQASNHRRVDGRWRALDRMLSRLAGEVRPAHRSLAVASRGPGQTR